MQKKTKLKGILSPLLQKIRLNKIIKYVTKPGTILDIGCDNGDLLIYLDQRPKYYLGIDNNYEIISDNINKYKNKKIKFTFCSIEDFKSDLKFDYIILAALIEHISDEVELSKLLKTLSHENTNIIITTPMPAAEKLLSIGAKFGIFAKESLEEHKKYYDKRELQKFADEQGFKVLHYNKFEFGLNQICVLKLI